MAETETNEAEAPKKTKKAAEPKQEPVEETPSRLVHLKIRRQDASDKPDTKRWEEFKVPYLPNMNVISALLSPTQKPAYLAEVHAKQERQRIEFGERQSKRPLLSLEEARARRQTFDWIAADLPRPEFFGLSRSRK